MPIGNRPYTGPVTGPSTPPRIIEQGDRGFGAAGGQVAPPPRMLDHRVETREAELVAGGLYAVTFQCDVASGFLLIERLFCRATTLGPLGALVLITVAPPSSSAAPIIEVATLISIPALGGYVASLDAQNPVLVPAGQVLSIVPSGGADSTVTAQYRVMVP